MQPADAEPLSTPAGAPGRRARELLPAARVVGAVPPALSGVPSPVWAASAHACTSWCPALEGSLRVCRLGCLCRGAVALTCAAPSRGSPSCLPLSSLHCGLEPTTAPWPFVSHRDRCPLCPDVQCLETRCFHSLSLFSVVRAGPEVEVAFAMLMLGVWICPEGRGSHRSEWLGLLA